jgi:hypothetical protein
MMTICSTSVIVPVREFAGIDSARLMLAGKAAETAPLINSWRNVRRSVVMTKACIDHLFRSRDESVTFSRIFKNLDSACAIDPVAEMAPYRWQRVSTIALLNSLSYNFGFRGLQNCFCRESALAWLNSVDKREREGNRARMKFLPVVLPAMAAVRASVQEPWLDSLRMADRQSPVWRGFRW